MTLISRRYYNSSFLARFPQFFCLDYCLHRRLSFNSLNFIADHSGFHRVHSWHVCSAPTKRSAFINNNDNKYQIKNVVPTIFTEWTKSKEWERAVAVRYGDRWGGRHCRRTASRHFAMRFPVIYSTPVMNERLSSTAIAHAERKNCSENESKETRAHIQNLHKYLRDLRLFSFHAIYIFLCYKWMNEWVFMRWC